MSERRSRRVRARIHRRGRMPSCAIITDEERAEAEAAYDRARAGLSDALEGLADALDRHAGEPLEWSTATFEAAAETWPSDTPLFPEGIGEALHDLAHPTPLAEQDGPPWTHRFPAVNDEAAPGSE